MTASTKNGHNDLYQNYNLLDTQQQHLWFCILHQQDYSEILRVFNQSHLIFL
jgi:alpha-amylase/alpha-mannosidase (GH57 family)